MILEEYSTMEIYKLSTSKIKDFRQLIELFGESFDQKDVYDNNSLSDEFLKSFLQNKNHIIYVANLENTIAGGLVAYVLEKFEKNRKEIYIYDLAVKEEYRRRKIATNLINELRHYSKSIGAYVIFVQADYEDDPAIKLYESLGKKEEVLHFDIDL